jgi:L-lactate dehydrogenase complex protein LldG
VCPVYARVGGHAYGSVYPGPIGAILTPQLIGIEEAPTLPYASSLCGACGEVCPVKIEIPRLLTHLRAREVRSRRRLDPEKLTMRALFHTFSSRRRYERAQKLARGAARPLTRAGRSGPDARRTIPWAPGPLGQWTTSRDLPAPAPETFREWWRRSGRSAPSGPTMSALTPHYGANADKVAEADRISGAGRPGGAPADDGDARADILHRIRSVLGDAVPADIPRNYRTEDVRERDEIVNLFAERVAEYRATVHRVGSGEVGEAVERIAADAGARRIGIPADLPHEWRPAGETADETGHIGRKRHEGPAGPGPGAGPGPAGGKDGRAEIEFVEDAALSVPQLDQLDGALTGCAVAIAETGTFVLDAGEAQGRRALTLVPDLHICVVREDQIVALVPEAVARLEQSVRTKRPLTFVSGPSATSDIELDRVEGVHGPRLLHVVVVAS